MLCFALSHNPWSLHHDFNQAAKCFIVVWFHSLRNVLCLQDIWHSDLLKSFTYCMDAVCQIRTFVPRY